MSKQVPLTEIARRLNRFYKLASNAVFDLDGTLDKMVGDQVMAFFGAPFRRDRHAERAVEAALAIVARVEDMVEDDDSLRVGGSAGTGEAMVGNVAEGEMQDFTAFGDVVNTASRLQGAAQPGEVLVMETSYRPVASQFPNTPKRTLELKGKAAPVVARRLVERIREWPEFSITTLPFPTAPRSSRGTRFSRPVRWQSQPTARPDPSQPGDNGHYYQSNHHHHPDANGNHIKDRVNELLN